MTRPRDSLSVIKKQGVDRFFLLSIRYVSHKINYEGIVKSLPRKLSMLTFLSNITLFKILLCILHKIHPTKYTVADPYKIIWVDPNEITHISGLHDKKRRGWVLDGNWDKECEYFLDKPVPNSIHQHYVEGVPWEDTSLSTLYDSPDKLKKKCGMIESLYNTIAEQGFKSQTELVNESPDESWKQSNATIAPLTNEITVDIGRDGEILWNMLGKHRLSIAKVLDLDEVPVLVFARHKEWEKKTHQDLINNKKKNNHPDLVTKGSNNILSLYGVGTSQSYAAISGHFCTNIKSISPNEIRGIDRILLLSQRYLASQLRLEDLIKKLPINLANFVFLLTTWWKKKETRFYRIIYPNRHTDANPYKIIKVSPSDIEFTTGYPLSKRRGWVVSGKWHLQGCAFFSQRTPKAIHEHYKKGLPWSETSFADRFDSQNRMEKRIQRVERTYQSINQNGYLSQSDMLKEDPNSTWSNTNDAMHPLLNEVAVDIGPNGEFLWNICGRHRLTIAKIKTCSTNNKTDALGPNLYHLRHFKTCWLCARVCCHDIFCSATW